MSKNEAVAAAIRRLLELLAKGPLSKPSLYKAFAEERDAYSDAIGALRVFGLVSVGTRKMVELTEFGHAMADGKVHISELELVEEFCASAQLEPSRARKLPGSWQPSLLAVERQITSIPERTTNALIASRRNAARERERVGTREGRLAMTLYVLAIDRELERRQLKFGDDWFRWPDTDAPGGDGSVDGQHFLQEGMLSVLGYRVGVTNGVATPERRQILQEAFEGPLPHVFPRSYMEKWGDRRSARRLHTLADTIAALTRNLKRRRDQRMGDAIRSYEADLEFLYVEFYLGRFGFGWPSTQI